jgi:hypothetical protein
MSGNPRGGAGAAHEGRTSSSVPVATRFILPLQRPVKCFYRSFLEEEE